MNDCEKSITHDFLDIDPPIFIVTSAWFWTSIIEGTVAKESEYLFNVSSNVLLFLSLFHFIELFFKITVFRFLALKKVILSLKILAWLWTAVYGQTNGKNLCS